MDELTIDDKKYISSKRAAQITGYAKDYIGQLCREGYVEAKRVGRSWYVLEAAIKDHRFGGAPHKEEKPVKSPPADAYGFTIVRKEAGEQAPSQTIGAPRYEALEPPSINLLRKDEIQQQERVSEIQDEGTKDFHAAWQVWFDAFHTPQEAATEPAKPLAPEPPVPDAPVQSDFNVPKGEGVIQIHHLAPQESPLIAPLPVHTPAVEEVVRIEDVMYRPQKPHVRANRRTGGIRVLFIALFTVISVFSASLALIGSGYLDNSIVSIKQAQMVSGISTVNK